MSETTYRPTLAYIFSIPDGVIVIFHWQPAGLLSWDETAAKNVYQVYFLCGGGG